MDTSRRLLLECTDHLGATACTLRCATTRRPFPSRSIRSSFPPTQKGPSNATPTPGTFRSNRPATPMKVSPRSSTAEPWHPTSLSLPPPAVSQAAQRRRGCPSRSPCRSSIVVCSVRSEPNDRVRTSNDSPSTRGCNSAIRKCPSITKCPYGHSRTRPPPSARPRLRTVFKYIVPLLLRRCTEPRCMTWEPMPGHYAVRLRSVSL